MGVKVEPGEAAAAAAQSSREGENQRTAVSRELGLILNSRTFQNSKRSKQFLSYVVEHALQGHTESLKERTIGVDLFHRAPTYLTGDDPVVRVKAAEVRRRLHQYYAEEAAPTEVRIDIPVGSYIPEFHWGAKALQGAKAKAAATFSRKHWGLIAATIAVVLVGAALIAALILSRHEHPTFAASPTVLDQFWAPLFRTSQPVLICLASPVVYRPSLELYKKAPSAERSEYQTEVDRFSNVLRLAPNQTLRWEEMVPYSEFYVAKGDADAAARLSALFAQIHKPDQLRVGNNYSFEDLRNSPAVLIGAFNNRWTLEMTSNLPFVFTEENGNGKIQERAPAGRVWVPRTDARGERIVDYAAVSRLLDSKTGQLLITAAGIGPWGTQAAADFISNKDFLAQGFKNAPPGWQTKSLEVVLETNVIDSVPGPPQVVAARFW